MPVNEDDVKAFIGLYLAMGIVRKPTIRSYWEHPVSNELFDIPCFREAMTRERFEKIMQYLHCKDNTTAQSAEPPYMILYIKLNQCSIWLMYRLQKILGKLFCKFHF